MKRLLTFLALCLPIYILAQGFGSFSHDQPYFAKDVVSGSTFPTSDHWGWYDASLVVSNAASSNSPPANGDRLGNWGVSMGNLSYLIGSRGGALDVPSYLSTGSNTNGPAIRNTALFSVYGQMSRSALAWCGQANLSQPITVFMVFKKTLNNNNGTNGIFRGENGTTFYVITPNASSNITMYAGTSLNGPAGAIERNKWYLITAQFNGANSFLRTNGVEYMTGDVGNNPIIGFSAGLFNSGTYLIGDYTDVIFYDRALDTNEIQAVELVLKTKNNL